ncbi:MAG: transposase [Candidatus Schmidhempelia sp.]|nr:transposase [Candidatus Schmidhempelia sp.]
MANLYRIVDLDCIVVKVRQDDSIIKKWVFLALAINTKDPKELLDLWITKNEEDNFWLSVLA